MLRQILWGVCVVFNLLVLPRRLHIAKIEVFHDLTAIVFFRIVHRRMAGMVLPLLLINEGFYLEMGTNRQGSSSRILELICRINDKDMKAGRIRRWHFYMLSIKLMQGRM